MGEENWGEREQGKISSLAQVQGAGDGYFFPNNDFMDEVPLLETRAEV